jgi:hypothetical protein
MEADIADLVIFIFVIITVEGTICASRTFLFHCILIYAFTFETYFNATVFLHLLLKILNYFFNIQGDSYSIIQTLTSGRSQSLHTLTKNV